MRAVRRVRRVLTTTNKVLLGLSLLVLGLLPWYRVQLTGSAPQGVWRLLRVPPVVERGMWVVLDLPAWYAAHVPQSKPLLKHVAAVAGDEVCVVNATLWISVGQDTEHKYGRNYGPIFHEHHGKPIPALGDGCFVVTSQHVFLANAALRSLDSRYFGAVPMAQLTAQARPFLTWRGPP